MAPTDRLASVRAREHEEVAAAVGVVAPVACVEAVLGAQLREHVVEPIERVDGGWEREVVAAREALGVGGLERVAVGASVGERREPRRRDRRRGAALALLSDDHAPRRQPRVERPRHAADADEFDGAGATDAARGMVEVPRALQHREHRVERLGGGREALPSHHDQVSARTARGLRDDVDAAELGESHRVLRARR